MTKKTAGNNSTSLCYGGCRLEEKPGSFSNGYGNENVRAAIGVLSKTTSFHVHHAFLYISLSLLARDYDVKLPNFTFYGGRKQVTTRFSFSF